MKFTALKTRDGGLKGDIFFYRRILHVSRQGFYQYPANKDRPWKYRLLADAMVEIPEEDDCNDTRGRVRVYQALMLKQPENADIPGERAIYRVMEDAGISHHPRRKPNGITKADREARKSEDLLKRDFMPGEPLARRVTDITEIRAGDGKLYVPAVFGRSGSGVAGLAADTGMKAPLCARTLKNAAEAYPGIRGAIIRGDRGSRYTGRPYREAIHQYGIRQSMDSAGGRCHDNARRGSVRAGMKSGLLYGRYDTGKMGTDELKTLIWIYFISCWNNRRIRSSDGGLPPMIKRQRYYDSLKEAA